MATRRDFIQRTAAAAGAAALSGVVPGTLHATGPTAPTERADRALRILILGGTGFTGPYQVRYAIERGHNVTVFNRGRRQGGLPEGVTHIQGDRNAPDGLGALRAEVARGTKWDVVIDNPTTLPHWVRDAGTVLKDATQHFIFISTISVYADTTKPGMDEDTRLEQYTGSDPLNETMQSFQQRMGELYGPLKAASEREAEKWFPGRTTVIRPGLIVGPGDTSGRFTYWPVRIAKGGDVLAPGTGHDPVQYIDARDLAEWTIRMAETKTTGIYNATGPAGTITMAEMLGGIRAAFDGTQKLVLRWAPVEVLAKHGVNGWSDMPVWVVPEPDNAGFARVSIDRALAQGLTFRPLAVTARDTLEWFNAQPEALRARIGGPMTAEREGAVLKDLG